MKKLLLLLLLLYPMSAAAEMYQWTDEKGTINFAEDLGKVPKNYRKKARRVGEENAQPQPPKSETVGEPKAAPSKGETPAGEKKLWGGRDEAAWRRDFGQAKANLDAAVMDLETLNGRLSDTSRMARSEYVAIQNSIRHSETRVKELQRRLEVLRETADRYGVPAEYRQ